MIKRDDWLDREGDFFFFLFFSFQDESPPVKKHHLRDARQSICKTLTPTIPPQEPTDPNTTHPEHPTPPETPHTKRVNPGFKHIYILTAPVASADP